MTENNSLPVHRGVGIIIDMGETWVLQQRDSKDGILWPGKISLWGGAVEPEDEGNYEKAAFRELNEETGLTQNDIKLICFGSLEFDHMLPSEQAVRQETKLFVAKSAPLASLAVHEGKGTYIIPANPDLSTLPTNSFAPGVTEAVSKLSSYYTYEKR